MPTTLKLQKNRPPLPSLHEERLRKRGISRIAGIDEVGRGPLAGPVVAAACVIAPGRLFPGVDDSKKLSPEKREEFFLLLTQETDYGVGVVEAEEIDAIGIVPATHLAMRKALAGLSEKPEYIIVDGPVVTFPEIPSMGIIKGDGLEQLIAAASIIAKVTRDRLMCAYDKLYPAYGFAKHKGYGTEEHIKNIKERGYCPLHRKCFKTC